MADGEYKEVEKPQEQIPTKNLETKSFILDGLKLCGAYNIKIETEIQDDGTIRVKKPTSNCTGICDGHNRTCPGYF